MPQTARRLLRYEDLLAYDAPDRQVPELVDGEIVYKASPRPAHARAHARLARLLGDFDRDDGGPGGWWLFVEPDVEVDETTVVRPDLAGWRRAPPGCTGPRAVRHRARLGVRDPLSGHESHDTRLKRAIYLRFRVPHYWIVDPEARRLDAWEQRDRRWEALGTWIPGDHARTPPFEAVELDVGAFFLPRGR